MAKKNMNATKERKYQHCVNISALPKWLNVASSVNVFGLNWFNF
jgi:hypothetical protein